MIRFLFANGGESDESGIKPWWRLAGNVRGHQHGMHKPREQGGCNQGGENNSEGSFHGFSLLRSSLVGRNRASKCDMAAPEAEIGGLLAGRVDTIWSMSLECAS